MAGKWPPQILPRVADTLVIAAAVALGAAPAASLSLGASTGGLGVAFCERAAGCAMAIGASSCRSSMRCGIALCMVEEPERIVQITKRPSSSSSAERQDRGQGRVGGGDGGATGCRSANAGARRGAARAAGAVGALLAQT